MADILRDPVWQFVGVILAFVALGLSLWMFFAQRLQKRLLVEGIANVPLVTHGAEGISGLQISFNGKRIKDASLLIFRVENVGNVPILRSDFENPIRIVLEAGARMLSAEIVRTKPKHFPIELEIAEGSLVVKEHLLNPGDTFSCRALVQNSKGDFVAETRVVGVSGIESARAVSFVQPAALVVGGIAMSIGAVYLTSRPWSSTPVGLRPEEIGYFIALLVS